MIRKTDTILTAQQLCNPHKKSVYSLCTCCFFSYFDSNFTCHQFSFTRTFYLVISRTIKILVKSKNLYIQVQIRCHVVNNKYPTFTALYSTDYLHQIVRYSNIEIIFYNAINESKIFHLQFCSTSISSFYTLI